ncbi:MAG TPA: cytochrome bc complex cytochrome b subunit [Candidatus Baltobacteraceae bacterium]|nr:cytochrome bc complex cytochrome b subunit [Candidatus Baltobacteraceae bacterium]
MIRRLALALDDRLGTAHFMRKALRKAFPDHWSFMLGEIALYCFVVLLATGVYLGFFFDASSQPLTYNGSYLSLHGIQMSAAYASVLRLSLDTRAGLLLRQIHHWAALVFLAAITVHMCRIFFTGAFRRPRELNWIIGLVLLILALGAGFTGYSLPDDLLSGTGLRIAYSVLISVPFVGTDLAFLFFGGAFPATETIGRLFFAHVLILPALIAAAMTLHLGIIWRQKHTQFRGPGRTENNVVGSPLWPNYAMKSAGLLFAVAAIVTALGAFFQINPIWLYGPYDPANVSAPAQPDWYIGWLEGALRLGPSWDWQIFNHTVPAPFFAGVLLPFVFFSLLFVWPFLERRITHDGEPHQLLDHPSDTPWRTGVGAAVLTFAIVLTFAGSDGVQAKIVGISVEMLASLYRIMLPVLPAVVGLLSFELARELRARRDALPGTDARIVISRADSGGFVGQPEEHRERRP